MFINIVESSIFVQILLLAFASILLVNFFAALINAALTIYMKVKRLQ